MTKAPLSLGDKLQKQLDKMNKRQEDNWRLFKQMGGDVGKPIDLMKLIKEKKP